MTEESLFVEALEVADPADRAAFLGRACAGDPGLRGRLEQLLDHHARVGSFLGRPAVGPPGTVTFAPDGSLTRTLPPAEPGEAPGTVIGPYKLLQQIGEGGMGTVYMAEQTHPVRRKLALKVIKAGMDSKQVVARFEAERQALALMDHVNIARVFDGGTTAAGRPYFVMELVHGVPITKYCDDHHLTPRQRLELFVPVCQAIQHAHQKGIIHRDVKPSNVMVTLYDGRPVPKVIDFGVAKATEQSLTERTLFTQYGTMVGTFEYMSPEQAEMSALGVDTRSDIYSLGVLLYELLTGGTPLSGRRLREAAHAEIVRMIKEEEAPRPSTRLSSSGDALASISASRKTEPGKLSQLMRGELDWIVMKTLEKDRTRRYETANGLAADVQRYLADEPVKACPPSAAYRFRKFARRNRRVLAAAAVLALALVVGTVGSTWQAVRATRAEGLAEDRLTAETEAQRTTREQLLLTQTAEVEATRQLFDARLAQARAGVLSRRVGHRFDSLAAVGEATRIARDLKLPEARFLDLRNAAIACLALPDLRPAKQWPDGGGNVAFDDRMEIYAQTDDHGAVRIRRMADDKEIAHLPATGTGGWVLLSGDGKSLATWSETNMKVWNLDRPDPVAVLNLSGDGFYPAFSPDGRLFANGLRDGPVRLYDLATGRIQRVFTGGPGTTGVTFRPKHRQIAIGRQTSIEIHDLDTGKVVKELPHQPYGPMNSAWHPDGETLAVVCHDLRIHLWDVAATKETVFLDKLTNGAWITFNHAGDMLATWGWEGKLRLWDPRTGRQRFSATLAGDPHFSPDDRHLAVINAFEGKAGLWEIAAGPEYRTMVTPSAGMTSPYSGPSVHRDGRLLAVGLLGGVGLWDLAGSRELHFIPLPGGTHAVFEPSGSLLTNGPDGLLRWAVHPDPATPGGVRLGPPQKLAVPGSNFDLACSADGRVIASVHYRGGYVLHTARPNQPIPLTQKEEMRYAAVSPDGKWVATSSHGPPGVTIWDAESGARSKVLPGMGWGVKFSPDGKWLGTTSGGYRLWEVGSWREGPTIGGGEGADFSPIGKLLAVETGSGAIRLVNPDTGREYARLQDPNQDRAGRLTFSPDGTQLVATTGDSQSIHVWDLRLIRARLVEMGLDWDLPSYPPAKPAAGPLKVEVDLGKPAAGKKSQP